MSAPRMSSPRRSTTARKATVGAIGALVLAGLSGTVADVGLAAPGPALDVAKVQRKVKIVVTQQAGARVASVSCPAKKQKQGNNFSCVVIGRDGSRGSARIVQRDNSGTVLISAPFVHPRDVEREIADGIEEQTSLQNVAVSCPEIIVAVTGRHFMCGASGGGSTATVYITLTNAHGDFDYHVK